MVNQPILRGFESYQSDMSYPRSLPPIVVVLAMFLTSFQTSQNNTQTPLLCGDNTQPSEKRVKNSSSEETQPNEVVGVSHASPGTQRGSSICLWLLPTRQDESRWRTI